MALVSPGVQVSVVDESFYTPAEPGTVPVIFCATAQDKPNASGTGIARGTLAGNAGVPYLLTSQRDLAETFGDPTFKVDSNNNPIHGSEINEYGLQAAYSFLGVSNRAWVVRAPVDLTALEPRSSVPTADPEGGKYWFDVSASLFGVQQWNGAPITVSGGQTFVNKVPFVITDATQTTGGAPRTSIGEIGDYAVVAITTLNTLWYRNRSGNWVEVGSPEWRASWATVQGSEAGFSISGTPVFTLNGTPVTMVDGWGPTEVSNFINSLALGGITAGVVDSRLEIYSTGEEGATTIVLGVQPGDSDLDAGLTTMGLASGTYNVPALQISKHTSVPAFKTGDTTPRPTGSIWLKTTEPNAGARIRVKRWNADTRVWETIEAPLFPTAEDALLELDRTGGGSNLSIGDLFVNTNVARETTPVANFKIFRRAAVGSTTIRSNKVIAGTFSAIEYKVQLSSTAPGSNTLNVGQGADAGLVTFTAAGTVDDAKTLAAAITAAAVPYVSAEVDSENRVIIKHTKGGDFKLENVNGSGDPLAALGINENTAYVSFEPGTDGNTSPKQFRASNWQVLTQATPSVDAPSTLAADGTLWYNSIVDEVDIMVNDGNAWRGYQNTQIGFNDSDKTDPNGPIVSATKPSKQSDGTELANGDLWIDTSDIENYPTIYKYRLATDKWELIDKADQTTENGIVFADARYGTSGVNGNVKADITDLLSVDYVDFDAPDPALYPKGMLLWNLRRSGFNVKKFVKDYVVTGDRNERMDESQALYNPDRWVTESANQVDGSGSFGRKAQRKVVLQAMQSVINNNDEIRDDEARIFNLISAPGYPELISEMVNLNYDRGLTGFVVGDSPARLTPDATSLNDWATNARLAVEDNDDGLVTRDEYLGLFYPWGYTSDNYGNNVVVPPSHMMLRTIALSDQVSYPWFAPAGTRRGGVTNASATGYINSEGEFVSVALNEGQRDTLYAQGVNPITFITGAGLVNFGQKTRARSNSSLDRINVSRLVIYLRSQLNTLAKPYIFEPNDKITRDEIKQQVESLLLELVGQRALYDFLVVCDESNNTPNRIDRNELYVDIAIEPVKAIEFIYIPLRLKNTGEIAGL